MASYPGFTAGVLKAAGLPLTRNNVDFIEKAWIPSEGTKAAYNPLATTTRRPGSTAFNTNSGYPVQNFKSVQDGISATAQTLLNGHYGSIVSLLKRGNASMNDLAKAVQQSPWGTKQGLIGTLAAGSKASFSSGQASSPIAAPSEINAGGVQGANPFTQRQAFAQHFLAQAQDTLQKGNAKTPNTSGWLSSLLAAVDPAEADAQTTGGTTVGPTSQVTGQMVGAASGAVGKVLQAAHKQVGKPYVFGSGPDTSSFDCSDLIQWSYKQIGVSIPRVTGDQIKVGKPVEWGKFRPGDLIFSNGGDHVVMYVGGGKVIAAPHTGTVVQYQPVSRFRSSFYGARRILA